MTQKRTTAKAKTPATKKTAAKKTVVLKAGNTLAPKAPKPEEIQDLDWINWVEYAQARIRYLESKVEMLTDELAAQKASNKRLNDRFMQG